ncbi:MAG: ATP-dependent RNA helicase RhlE [Bacteroidia bacterium]|nr:MAG: ATP-dependent RNA helicase RhlE [Bacteroidia bacterium]
MSFSSFGLSDRILRGVQASGYTVPTPIQTLAIRPALEGRDVIGTAQTGTGKTAAFVLPMLHRLEELRPSRTHYPRALVLTPTRELAHQVHEAVSTYGKFMSLRSGAIYGGVGMEPQIRLLRSGVDVVIATPGRLLDHMQRKTINLSNVQMFVLDEADRMFAMGFIRDVRKIIAALPSHKQTMLFSATFSKEISELASGVLKNPHRAEVGHSHEPLTSITQNFYSTVSQAKMELLLHVLKAEAMDSVLVFTRTKHGADKLTRRLDRKGIAATAIHSNKSQSQRLRSLEAFRRGKFRVLVATDIAARGIDVDGISHVINFDMPRDAEDYVHRIGRTGRAGLSGKALTFVTGEDRDMVRRIERFTGRAVATGEYPGFKAASVQCVPVRSGKRTTGLGPSTPGNGTRGFRKDGRRKPLAFASKKKRGRKMEFYSSARSWENR